MNCGPPPCNSFDLEIGPRSWYGANWKGLSQGSCMPNINALSLILQKIWARLKFLGRTDRGTDRRMSSNVPLFCKRRGTKIFSTSAVVERWVPYMCKDSIHMHKNCLSQQNIALHIAGPIVCFSRQHAYPTHRGTAGEITNQIYSSRSKINQVSCLYCNYLVSLLADRRSLRAHVAKFYGWLRLIRSVRELQNVLCLKAT